MPIISKPTRVGWITTTAIDHILPNSFPGRNFKTAIYR